MKVNFNTKDYHLMQFMLGTGQQKLYYRWIKMMTIGPYKTIIAQQLFFKTNNKSCNSSTRS